MQTPVTLTINNVPVYVRSLLAARGQDVSNLRNPRIVAMIGSALEAMAYRVARGPDYRGLQNDFFLTPAAGVIEDWTAGIIFDIARSEVRDANTNVPLTPLDSVHALALASLPSDQVYYAQEGDKIRFRATNGALDTYATPVRITANFIPSLTDIPPEYHGLFFNTLAGLLTEPRPEMRAQELSEVGRA